MAGIWNGIQGTFEGGCRTHLITSRRETIGGCRPFSATAPSLSAAVRNGTPTVYKTKMAKEGTAVVIE